MFNVHTYPLGRHPNALPLTSSKSEIGFMVAALKGMIREQHRRGAKFEDAHSKPTLIRIPTLEELKRSIADICRHHDDVSMIMIEAWQYSSAITRSYAIGKQGLVDTLLENLRVTDYLFELADGQLAIVMGNTKLLTGIMIAERLGAAAKAAHSNRIKVKLGMGVSCISAEITIDEALMQAQEAKQIALSDKVGVNSVTSLLFSIE